MSNLLSCKGLWFQECLSVQLYSHFPVLSLVLKPLLCNEIFAVLVANLLNKLAIKHSSCRFLILTLQHNRYAFSRTREDKYKNVVCMNRLSRNINNASFLWLSFKTSHIMSKIFLQWKNKTASLSALLQVNSFFQRGRVSTKKSSLLLSLSVIFHFLLPFAVTSA